MVISFSGTLGNKIFQSCFPDTMPHYKKGSACNDNSVAVQVYREAMMVFHRIRQLSDWDAISILEHVALETTETVNFMRTRNLHNDSVKFH